MSAVFSSGKDVLSKRVSFRLDGTASTFASFAFALPFYLLVLGILHFREHDPYTISSAFLTLLLLRSITDTFAEWLKMHALAHGDLSVVSLFFAMSPLLLLVTSPLITGDPLKTGEVIAVFFVVGGSILMVYRPSSTSWARQKKGLLLAAGASLFFSLNSCFDRLAMRTGSPAVVGFPLAVFAGFGMTLLSALFLSPFVLTRRDRLQSLRSHSWALLSRGLLEVAFMVCKLYALESLDAPAVAGIQRLSLLISIIGGRVFFREEDFGRRLAAGSLIVAGVTLIAWWDR
jgi:drug/metabolite transporter (DMT)-like permease